MPRLPRADPAGDLRVAYLGTRALRVRGAYTGRLYRFSPSARIQRVDGRDSRVLLRTRFFRRMKSS